MHVLLEGAVVHAAAHGTEAVEAVEAVEVAEVADADGDRIDVVSGYVGTTQLFEAAGFGRVLQTARRSGGRPRWLVRLEL